MSKPLISSHRPAAPMDMPIIRNIILILFVSLKLFVLAGATGTPVAARPLGLPYLRSPGIQFVTSGASALLFSKAGLVRRLLERDDTLWHSLQLPDTDNRAPSRPCVPELHASSTAQYKLLCL